MGRPDIGSLTGAASLDDESYLDFVEGMRAFNLSRMIPQAIASGDAFGQTLSNQTPRPSAEDMFHALGKAPMHQFTRRMMRTTQTMMWRGVDTSYSRMADDLKQRLIDAEAAAPDRLRIDPDFVLPDYIRQQDIHLQPGSYHTDGLAGFTSHYGSKIFFTGGNDDDALHRKMVDWCPIDGDPKRIVDLGCGIGQTTTAMKQRFPDAEVIGIDVSAPMLRYAHYRAMQMNSNVIYSQRSAADTDVETGSVDAIMAMILFHEVPAETAEGIVSEAARMLRPGGTMTIIDFPHIHPTELSGRHTVRMFDNWYNGEPFSADFVYSDFPQLLRRHFDDVDPDFRPAATSTGALRILVCRKAS